MSKRQHHTGTEKPEGAVLVAGAGIAGMQSSLDLAENGFKVFLVEENISIGGIMAQLDKTFPTNDCSTCMLSPKLIEVAQNPNIEIISRGRVEELSGSPGRFTARVIKKPRFIDEDACTGCGECVKVCPVEVPADFNQGLNPRKAIYRHFPQAVPAALAIDKLGESPCQNACPAGISVQGYVALTAQGRYAEALDLIRRENPLAAVCGRVCTKPCEQACTRVKVDEAVDIRGIKRFAADWGLVHDHQKPPEPKERFNEKVAVIGSGPAGLSCAYYLALKGYSPTIFEALPAAGGMLRVGIPAYRLPRQILDCEIEYIKSAGVDIRLNSPMGPDFGLQEMGKQGYQAVFMGVGAHKGIHTGVPGERLSGVELGVEFLRRAALDQAERPGEKVAVIGGGNVAIDAARTALRLGSREVTIFYRRTENEMPAYDEEVTEALEEGIKLVTLTAPEGYLGTGGRLTAMETISMKLGDADADGRRRPVPIEGSQKKVEVDAVLLAVGQKADLDFLEPRSEIGLTSNSRIEVDAATLQTNLPHVFAGGDAVTGPATVVEAVQAGKEAAQNIHEFLRNGKVKPKQPALKPLAEVDIKGVRRSARQKPSALLPQERLTCFDEVVCGLSEEQVIDEASRCLSCGICSNCRLCEDVCQAGAINHDMKPVERDLKVGAVIMAPGFQPFDAGQRPEFGYGRYANVITSLEFERINSASGPYEGHVKRPGDAKEPKRVAWIQCVGSRDASIGRDYCSYVCCMYATKQAIIAKEHVPGLDASIFYMDIRAQGKGFDRYYQRAKDEHKVHYVRSMVSKVEEDPETGDLIIHYFDEQDIEHCETFDLVVLSVGMTPHKSGVELAGRLGVNLDRFGFCGREEINPLITSRPGVFVCGAFQAPRDIPDTVIQALGAAAQAEEILAPARGLSLKEIQYPPEHDVEDQEPRIGVFVCHCGVNIGAVVDVPEVTRYASGLPGVVHAEDFIFTCSTDSQEKMAAAIKEHKLNRVVVASCSPRTHEPLFRETLMRTGLNPYLFEMANIRDQCSWVHQKDPELATEKSCDLVRMSVARAGILAPLSRSESPVTQAALIVGGGPAGLSAALSLGDQGFGVHLVECSDRLGGLASRLSQTLEGFSVPEFLEDLIDRATHHESIRVHLNSSVLETKGSVGRFESRLISGEQEQVVEHGATIIATGAREYQPSEYGYGQDSRVMTQLSLHEALHKSDGKDDLPGRVVMIQCVGSRNEEHSYCSRTCCSQAVGNAIALLEKNPGAQVTILFRDLRTFALKELYYKKAREMGVRFIRFDPDEPPQVEDKDGLLSIRVFDQGLRTWIRLSADALVLSAAARPREDTAKLASAMKLALDADGFFMEAHLKLRPVDMATGGVFLAGAAHGPKFLEEAVTQAKAASSRAATILSKQALSVGGEVAVVDAERCVACLTCVRTCPFGVPVIGPEGVVEIDPAACQGCGSCAAACPRKLIQLQHHTDAQILAKARAI